MYGITTLNGTKTNKLQQNTEQDKEWNEIGYNKTQLKRIYPSTDNCTHNMQPHRIFMASNSPAFGVHLFFLSLTNLVGNLLSHPNSNTKRHVLPLDHQYSFFSLVSATVRTILSNDINLWTGSPPSKKETVYQLTRVFESEYKNPLVGTYEMLDFVRYCFHHSVYFARLNIFQKINYRHDSAHRLKVSTATSGNKTLLVRIVLPTKVTLYRVLKNRKCKFEANDMFRYIVLFT